MADPITTVVTVISEHPQAAAAVASIYGVAKPFLAKILGPGAEEIGEIGRDYIKGQRAKNAKRTLADADNLLAATGREPQGVPLAIAVPLLESASLQDDPTLAKKWAALLANAADPAQRVTVQPGFVEVLRQFTPTDAQVLAHVYRQVPADFGVSNYSISQISTTGFMNELGLTQREFAISVENLLRLRLCDTALGSKILPGNSELPPPVAASVYPTIFGHEFLLAVTPPII